jgi:hypothetical protein
MAPGVSWMSAATPSLPCVAMGSFQGTDLSAPGVHSSCSALATAAMCEVNANVVPLLSARVTTVMETSAGRAAPETWPPRPAS